MSNLTHGPRQNFVIPHDTLADWFYAPPGVDKLLVGVPGVQYPRRGDPIIHRSHLPLLKLAAHMPDTKDAETVIRWTKRDQASADRYFLRPYQHQAVDFLLARRGALLADQQRLGKTITSLATHDPSTGPLLVVCPLPVREVWRSWITRVFPGAEISMFASKKYSQDVLKKSADFCIIHYDIVPYWMAFGVHRGIGTLIFDEAHILSNYRSRRSEAAYVLAPYAKRVIALTGTPLWNRPKGLWTIISLVANAAFGTRFEFLTRYCDGHPGTHGFIANGISRTAELQSRLQEIMLRRTWTDVRKDLPPISTTVEIADLSSRELNQIEDIAEQVKNAIARRVYTGELARYRRILGNVKAKTAIDCALRILDSGEPVVIWSWHKDVARIIEQTVLAKKRSAYRIDGDVPNDNRESILASWRQDPCAALVITISVGQTGIDLSHARQAIFSELSFTPAEIGQALYRTYTPDRPMAATYVAANHEVDLTLVQVLSEKCAIGAQIGVPAVESALDVIGKAFGLSDSDATPDLDRLMQTWLSIPETAEVNG